MKAYLLLLFAIIVIVLSTVLVINTTTTKTAASPLAKIFTSSPHKDIAFLVHSFDGYKRYWPGFVHFFDKHHASPWPIYFATEDLDPPKSAVNTYTPIKCGKGQWGRRLLAALKQIPEKYVVYLQEDMWLTNHLSREYMDKAAHMIKKYKWLLLKLQTNCYHDIDVRNDVNDPKWYVASHQPGIWLKDFLLSTLEPEMSPFKHETTINHMLHQPENLDIAVKCQCNLDFRALPFPYEDVSRQGSLRDIGRKMLKDDKLEFRIGENEVTFRGI
jgi:hypothetical protein